MRPAYTDRLDADSRAFLDRVNAARGAMPPITNARAMRLMERAAIPPADAVRARLHTITDRTIPGPDGTTLPVRLYRPRDAQGGALVYFHGGGFVLGDLDTHDGLCATLSAESGCLVLAVAYRLAPEHRFPAPILDADAAVRWMAANAATLGADPARLAVGGDSAGGNLAANCCLMARDRGNDPPIAFQLLLQPVTHRVTRVASQDEFAEGYLLTDAMMRWFRTQYRTPDSSFAYDGPFDAADHRGLPPALIVTAECDPIRDQGAEYAHVLRAAGVAAEYICYQGTIHNFMLYAHQIAQGREALMLAAAALRRALTNT